ncbi:oligosaccharide flippase family protein [Granulosicoccus antarcticus]|uniref:Uncharacterized protein n=1 Tax=Granulosicoccus antarcticus IMCC3135 TaxID=1192854 RepID=A0A2Z2NTT5_9GAMM|nr:oligosaccharide flippase family protein [Granulosicoccus antarcticus]ASJ74972.1 hypothetical protein IMCC3135_24525 [Granulosicoccus antarcticus IMCC3135]
MVEVGMLRHLRNYATAGIISAVVGLVSFPILTRNLSVADYGVVGLVTSSLTLCIAIGKLGVQHSVIRFFSQIKNGNIGFTVGQMNSTVSMVFFALAAMATALWLFSGFVILPNVLQNDNIASLFSLAAIIVFIRLLGSGVMNFLRAQQRSGVVAIAQSVSRFLNLSLILVLLLLGDLDPWSVISCLLIAELVGVIYTAYHYLPDFEFRMSDVSMKLAKALLMYGLPLMMLESLGLVLRLSDRYLIESIMGVSALGQYSASYNLTAYIDIIILATLIQAVKPAYMQLWESDGRVATQKFLTSGFHLYMVVGIPFIAMFSLTSPHLLSFLAGDKYSPGTVIIPYVAISFWLEGTMHFLAAGLYIFKNTKVLMGWSLVATVINLSLNVLLIPRFGITGAAIVTIISYVIFMAGVGSQAFKHVDFAIKLRIPLQILAASGAVFLVLNPMTFGSDVADFLIKGVLGSSILLALLWFVDAGFRQWLSLNLNKWLRRA